MKARKAFQKKFKTTLNASKSLVTGNYELATTIVVQICANRLLLDQETQTEIDRLTSQLNRNTIQKERLKSKVYIVELQLKRILEEKRVLDQEVAGLSGEIGRDEAALGKLKKQLI